MTLNYNVTGAKRKELVNLIANFTGCDAHYKGAPSFAYEVDYFTIDRNGAVSFDDRADSEVIERLIEMLYDNSFAADEPTGIAIQIPAAELNEAQLLNLHAILDAKGTLIKKALGIDSLPVGRIDERLDFPWFSTDFLLRLGFIGEEYKADRKILLRNLSGSSAFKAPKPVEVESCE